MEKTIDIFIGGSTDQNLSQNYHEAAVELGKKINERKDYTMTFDGCLGLPFLAFSQLDYYPRARIYKTQYYGYDYHYKCNAQLRVFRYQSDFIRNIPLGSDAMIFMKGGPSTITEIMYAIESKKNKEHDKPIVILNINDEWNEFTTLLETFNMKDVFYITDNVLDALNHIEGELFIETSSFYRYELQFFQRKEPIVEKNKQLIKSNL